MSARSRFRLNEAVTYVIGTLCYPRALAEGPQRSSFTMTPLWSWWNATSRSSQASGPDSRNFLWAKDQVSQD